VVAAYLLVNLLLIIPVVASIVRALDPLEADGTGTRFTGAHSGWEIYTVTGWVTTTQSHMGAYGYGEGAVLSRVTDMLRLTDGTLEYAVSVDDFDVWLHPGQVATVCQAINGQRAEYIAVINDSTGEQFYNERALWRVAAPGFDRLLIALFAGLFFWLLLVAVIAWAVVVRSQVRRFQYVGVGPLLRRANSEAYTLRKPWAALALGGMGPTAWSGQRKRHEGVVAGDRVAAEGAARDESFAGIQRAGGGEARRRSGLQVNPP
jgi:hypothetical protein